MSTTILDRAYIGMQCFWGVESSFAQLSGVMRTRVGYAGGTSPNPTYAHIGDHTEIVELMYDSTVTSFAQILDHFWSHHDATIDHRKQYASAIIYVDDEQRQLAQLSKDNRQLITSPRKIATYIQAFEHFYQAEDYHQKYWLRTQPAIYDSLKLSDRDIIESTLATKVNAYLAGFQDFHMLDQLRDNNHLSDDNYKLIRSLAEAGGVSGSCHHESDNSSKYCDDCKIHHD